MPRCSDSASAATSSPARPRSTRRTLREPATVDRRIPAFLQLAEEELSAAESLARSHPRQSAHFAQRAVEKLGRAILAAEGIPFGTSHSLGQLAASLPAAHRRRARLAAFDRLSPAATTFGDPTPGGRLARPPASADLLQDLADSRRLRDDVRTGL